MTPRYHIRFAGDLDVALRAFPGFQVAAAGRIITVVGEFDQAGLHGVLERIRRLGYEVIGVQRAPPEGPIE